MQHYRLTLFALFASAILVVSLIRPENVLAQDETPPPDDPIPTQPTQGSNDAAISDVLPTEPPALIVTVTDEPVQQEPVSVSEFLDQVPDGMNVIVLGEDGQPEPLASQAAVEIIVQGDPMWCPSGQNPGTDMNDSIQDCTAHFTSFTALIVELMNFTGNDVGAGTIYIDSNYSATGLNPDAGSDIIFDYGAVALTSLVFQGGWNFGSNTVVGTSDLTGIGSLQFWDWGGFGVPGSLTLRNIILTGGDGLYIGDNSATTMAKVTLSKVTVTDTTYGAEIQTDGSVLVSGSDFSYNGSDGLDIESGGTITLRNVNANGNNGVGTVLEHCACPGIGNINVFSGGFNANGSAGLFVLSGGNVTLSEIDTFDNGSRGIIVESNGNVTLTDLNSGYNGDIGVAVFSRGDVSIADSWIGFNNSLGFGVENDGNVTLTNSAFFDNIDPGAYVTSYGSVNVSNSFFGNCFFGPSMCQAQPVGLVVEAVGPINIFNSEFNQNTDLGLLLLSNSDVVLNDVTANGNYVGAVVLTSGTVQVCDGSYSNNSRFGFVAITDSLFISEQTLLTGNGDAPIDLGLGTTLLMYNCAPKTPRIIQNEISCEDDQIGLEVHLPNGDILLGVKLDLPNGDNLIVPCPMSGPASVDHVDFSQLPGSLPDGFKFVSALHAEAARDDLMVSFIMPVPDASYIILQWNGTAWVELKGVATAESMFTVYPVDPGIYVLVTK